MQNNILCICLNQEEDMFAVGTDKGYQIYSVDKGKIELKFSRDMGQGLGLVQMFYRSNILALVGGGGNPRFPENKVIIWDDNTVKCVGEMTFKDTVKNVKLRTDKIIIVLIKKTYVYEFKTLKQLDQFETANNPKGIIGVNFEERCSLALPNNQEGTVLVVNYANGLKSQHVINVDPLGQSINFLSVDKPGQRLAVAFNKGISIRIYSTEKGELIQEFKRGSNTANIDCISFSPNGNWIGVHSDRGTVHIFQAKTPELQQQQTQNFIYRLMQSTDPQTIATLKIEDKKAQIMFQENHVTVLSQDDKVYAAELDPSHTKGAVLESTQTKLIQPDPN